MDSTQDAHIYYAAQVHPTRIELEGVLICVMRDNRMNPRSRTFLATRRRSKTIMKGSINIQKTELGLVITYKSMFARRVETIKRRALYLSVRENLKAEVIRIETKNFTRKRVVSFCSYVFV